ncbi:hypothetical protein [Microbispora hainanensis]|uniref:hypothetical protein n=1 Tax=Microbispora hainanensis TaxID=568844 RepID=UPI003256355B
MEIGIFSTGNLAGDPSVGATATERLRGLVKLAQRAEQAAPHVRYFRERYAAHGHGTAESAPVGSGAKVHVGLRSQDALREFEAQRPDLSKWPYDTLEEAIRHSALTVGSPAQVLDKIAHFQEQYGGYQRQMFSIDQPGGAFDQMLEQIDLLGEHILPALRAAYAHA